MDFKEGKLDYPIGELIPGPFGGIEGKKPQQKPKPADKKESKGEPAVVVKKERI